MAADLLDEIIGPIIVIIFLLITIVTLCGLIYHFITLPRKIVIYSTPNFYQAVTDSPVPREFLKLKWPRWKRWSCYLREQDDKQFGLFYARTVQDGLIIREYSHLKPKIIFFVPWRALSEPKRIKSPWYIWAKRPYALNIKGTPITLLITKHAFEKIKNSL